MTFSAGNRQNSNTQSKCGRRVEGEKGWTVENSKHTYSCISVTCGRSNTAHTMQWLQCFNELKCTMLSRMYAPNVMEKDMQALEKVFRNEYIRPNYICSTVCRVIRLKLIFCVRAHAFWGKNPISSMRDTFIGGETIFRQQPFFWQLQNTYAQYVIVCDCNWIYRTLCLKWPFKAPRRLRK